MSQPSQAEVIFFAALEKATPAERAAYLEEACADDDTLRRRVERLLAAHPQVGQFLERPVVEAEGVATLAGAENDAVDLSFLAPSTRPDSLGRLGHYEVLQVLGKGGFSIVLRTFDEALQRVVAVKVLAAPMAATSPARKRFLREARSSARVRHENVVQVYAVEEQPLPYLVMEFIPGETLQQRCDRIGPLEVPEILRIGRQIAEGLAAAHANGLIHRDVKPANVLIERGPHEHVKLTDFGLARAADDASVSQSGVVAGTPMYMAPEQAQGDRLDHRSDLFSLGSVLYVMCTGRPPFRAKSALSVLKRVAEDEPRPIRAVIPEVPDWLCGIVAKLHAKDPAARFQTAREVADLLADCEAKLKAQQEVKNTLPAPAVEPTAPTAPAGRMKWAAAAAVVLLPLIALAVTEFAGVTHLFRGPGPTPDPGKPGREPTPVAVARQEALPPTFQNSIGMEFVIVPRGKAWLGGGEDRPGDREVAFPADFYLGKYEVTQEEWEKVMGENRSDFSRNGFLRDRVKDIPDADLKRFPVESVSWDQCQAFVAKLNRREKGTGWVYRLPKEAEWEYACRGGPMADKVDSAFDYYFAQPTNTLLPEQANFQHDNGLERPCKVGSYEANRLGLFDMHGNVAEWCDDAVAAADGTRRVLRNGGWHAESGNSRVHFRFPKPPSDRHGGHGLRLARVPSGAPSPEAKSP
jgi:formylglycine-generating enzyme required for sulfatase activity/tRNA A-37 threonylcarbamoyl transferase component Bud32